MAGIAFIDESRCIGCARCLEVCPTDAIVGAPQRLHTIVAAACIGCERCIPPCPIDCIEMLPQAERSPEARREFAKEIKARVARRTQRLARTYAPLTVEHDLLLQIKRNKT